MISGLTLEHSVENLALTFLAALQALAYGTRHIVQELQRHLFTDINKIHIFSNRYLSSFIQVTNSSICIFSDVKERLCHQGCNHMWWPVKKRGICSNKFRCIANRDNKATSNGIGSTRSSNAWCCRSSF